MLTVGDKLPQFELPARLRMMRLGQAASSRVNLELFSLAVSAMAGCEACVRSHERVLAEHGMPPEQVHDAVRIAATVNAAATALELGSARGEG
jgi:lipoyl-dependent peroxiredoxin subunit D